MRSSRLHKTKHQDDASGVRWDPHAGKHRSGWQHYSIYGKLYLQDRPSCHFGGTSWGWKYYSEINFPLSKRGLGRFELFLLRHCEERLMRRGNLIYQNFLMFLIHCLRVINKKTKGTLPAVKRHPSTEGNCWIYSPIEGGFRGGVPFTFLFHHFLLTHLFSG